MNTLQPHEIREQKERESAKIANEKIKIVIGILGFEVKPEDKDGMKCYWRATAWTEPKDGLTLHFSQGYGSHSSRISISGGYPRTAKGEYIRPNGYNEKREDEITVSIDKSPQQMVKDIESRLLPVCAKYLAEVKKQITSADDYENTTVSTLETIKGGKLDEYEARNKEVALIVANGYGHAKASRREVSLDIHGLSLEVALQIIALLPKK